MKENVTKFDLEAAFKALDEVDVPVVKGIKANKADLTESIRRTPNTEVLIEDYYNVSDSGDLEQAQAEREEEVAKAKLARIEKIVDLDATTADELLPSYVGKVIIQCPQCMTLFYKNAEDIEHSEDDDTIVNVNEVCQHCGNASGYTIIGKVDGITEEEADNYEEAEAATDEATAEDDTELDLTPEDDTTEEDTEEETTEGELEPVETEKETEDEDKKEESLETSTATPLIETLTESKMSKADLEARLEAGEEVELGYNEDAAGLEIAFGGANYASTTYRALKDGDVYCLCSTFTSDDGDEVEGDTEEFDTLEELIFAIRDLKLEDSIELEESCKKPLKEEDEASDAEIEELFNSKEFKTPISKTEVDGYLDSEVKESFDDVEEIDEESMEEKLTESLTNVYSNVKSFKLAECKLDGTKLIVEGIITFNSGKIKNTTYTFDTTTSKTMSGLNEDLSKNGTFKLNYAISNKTLFTESISYRYLINENLVEGATTLTEAPKFFKNLKQGIKNTVDKIKTAVAKDKTKLNKLLTANNTTTYYVAEVDARNKHSKPTAFTTINAAETAAIALSKTLTNKLSTVNIFINKDNKAGTPIDIYAYQKGTLKTDNLNNLINNINNSNAVEQAKADDETAVKEIAKEEQIKNEKALTVTDIQKAPYSEKGKFIISCKSDIPDLVIKSIYGIKGPKVLIGLDNTLKILETLATNIPGVTYTVKYLAPDSTKYSEVLLAKDASGIKDKDFTKYLTSYPVVVEKEAAKEPEETEEIPEEIPEETPEELAA